MIRVEERRNEQKTRREASPRAALHCGPVRIDNGLKLADQDIASSFLTGGEATRTYSFADKMPRFEHKDRDVVFGFLWSHNDAARALSFADEIPEFKHKEGRMTLRP